MNCQPQRKYFLSNVFVEKIFDELQLKQETIKFQVEYQIEALRRKMKEVIEINEKEIPSLEGKIVFMNSKSTATSYYIAS